MGCCCDGEETVWCCGGDEGCVVSLMAFYMMRRFIGIILT